MSFFDIVQVAGGKIMIRDSSGNLIGSYLDGAIYRLETRSQLATGDNWAGKLKIGDGTNVVDVIIDTVDGVNRVPVIGKVSITAPEPPPNTTEVQINAFSPLEISADHDTDYVIPNGKRFTVQSVFVTSTGDPTTKGSGVNVVFSQNTVETYVVVIHIMGQPFEYTPDTVQDVSGNYLDGNAGGTNKVIIRRRRFSSTSLEVFSRVRGYLTDTP